MKRFFSLILALALLLLAVPFSFAAEEETAYPRTVYLADGGTGDGSSALTPAGSLTDLVDSATAATHVILTGDYTTAANGSSSNMFLQNTVPVKITAQNGARLILASHIVMNKGALELDDLTIRADGDYWLKMQSHSLHVGKNVLCTLGSGNASYPTIVGTTNGSITGQGSSLFVESGEWKVIRGGSSYTGAGSSSGSVFNTTITGGVFHSYVAFGSRGQVTGGEVNVEISGGTFLGGLYCIYGESDTTGYKADYRMTMRITGGTFYGAILPSEKISTTLTGRFDLALLGGDFSHVTDVRGAEENEGTMQSTLLVADGLLDFVPDRTTTFTNTFGAGADPFLFYYDHCYYLTRTASKSLAIRKASCLADLKTAPERLVYTIQDGSDLWSPEVHYISEAEAGKNAGWYCYFGYASDSVQGSSVAERQRAYVIKCLDGDDLVYGRWGDPVTGEINVARKLTNDSDAAFNNGGLYSGFSKLRIGTTLYFSYVTEFGRGTSGFHQEIMISAVTNPWTLTGTPVSVCRSEYDWEQVGYGYSGGKWYPKVVEGASVVYYDDENGNEQFYLMYTGSGYWTQGYALGYLRCIDPEHPLVAENWEKATATPVLRYDYSKNNINGSGHGSYIRTESGHWLAYHGYLTQNAGGSRNIFIEPMTVTSAGVSIGDGDGHPANLSKVYTVPVTERSLRETIDGDTFTTVTETDDPAVAEKTVFVDGVSGKDTGLGLSASAPYQTVAAAAARLALFGDGGRIVVSGRTVLPANTVLPDLGGELTLTSVWGESDYRSSGACLLPAGTVTLGGDLVLDALDLVLPSSVSYFYARFCNFAVTGCRAYTNAGTASSPGKGALNTTDYRLGVIAGGADAGTPIPDAVAQTISLESLCWFRAAGGSKAVGGSTYTSADLTPAASGKTVIRVGGTASVRAVDTVSSVETAVILPVSLCGSVTVKTANAPDSTAQTTVFMTEAIQQSGLTERLSFSGGLTRYLEKGFSMRAKATGRGYGMRAGFVGSAELLADAEEIGVLVKRADNPNPFVWFAGTDAVDENRIGKSRSRTAGTDDRCDTATVPGSYLFNAPLIFDDGGTHGYVEQADTRYVFLPYAVYSFTTANGVTAPVCLYGEDENAFTFREVAMYISKNKAGAQKETADAALADMLPPIDRLVPSDGEKIRIAFIGDSITQGTGTPLADQPAQSYPGQLQTLLGDDYVVGNFGKASSYTLPADDPYNVRTDATLSYRNTQQYKDSLAFGADIVVIALGCNDIRSFSCEEAFRHYKDALASLANEYASRPTVQKVYIATHIAATNAAVIRQFSEGVLQTLQREVAAENGFEVIDMYEMTHDYFNVMMHHNADRLHPNCEQYGEMARAYCAFFKGKTFTPSVPEESASGVVYVKTGGLSFGQGAAPSTALDSLAKAVGLLRETGGTVVICGPYATTYETHLPNTNARITVTSSYGGVDYASAAGAYLGLAHNLYLYGDYTFEDLTVRADVANSIIIGNYHNNVFGDGITCTLKSGVSSYPLLLVGYNVSLGGVPVETITLHGACSVAVDSGTWAYLRCGNRRPNVAYPVGGVDADAVLDVTVNGGTYRNTSTNLTAATGMNSTAGTCRLTINGGEFRGSVYAVSRIGGNTSGIPAVMSGNVYLTVNGGTIAGSIGAVQDSTISVTGGVYLTVAEALSSKVTESGFTEVTVLSEPEPPVEIPVSNNLLFSPTKSGIYNYCPTVFEEEDGTRYVYYCTNKTGYNVTDYIGCRVGTPNADGTYAYGAETLVLSPSSGAWDSRHVCDPSVIRGSFSYQGTTYSYLMAYLGCSSSDNQENKVGLAVANSPTGPFVKVGASPIVDFTKDSTVTSFQWGVGQPCLVSQDKAGKVWLFYTRGDKNGTRTIARTGNFANLDSPTLGSETRVSVTNLQTLTGGTDILNNADFAYAGGTVFYSASDCHPNPTDAPDFISSAFRITRLERFTSGGVAFTSTNASWTNLAVVGLDETGFARNHNVCLVRDEYGWLPERDYLTVYYSMSNTGSGNSSLWTYRIYDWNMALR